METKYRPSCRLSLSNYHGYEIWRQLGIHDLAVDATTLRFFLVYPPLCDKNSLFLGGACDLYSCVWIIANGVNLVHWQTRRHYIQFRGTSNLLFLLNHRLHHLCDWQAVKSGVMLSGSPSRSWCLPLVLSIESTSRLQRDPKVSPTNRITQRHWIGTPASGAVDNVVCASISLYSWSCGIIRTFKDRPSAGKWIRPTLG
ncbi:predicted protein [Lichtheimia corymbifera JMRC:FSU:9682]|uniref:Uncharacterized protein n=1 Tax=Lichtheimia corymbifera JMRC:FSU:9682 TaxID=1263082 RepID=A0A068RQA1_9FUNG|nr:predicted protein [Lichtheimia corymbifera JMRC:FSU:9682]